MSETQLMITTFLSGVSSYLTLLIKKHRHCYPNYALAKQQGASHTLAGLHGKSCAVIVSANQKVLTQLVLRE